MAHIFFDFDSTLVSVETLDALVAKSVTADKLNEIHKITNQGMSGELSLEQSLTIRINKANITKQQVLKLANKLPSLTTSGLKNIIKELQNNGHIIYILSGGFIDYMQPTATKLNISKNNIFANKLSYNSADIVNGFDRDNVLYMNKGKVKIIEGLNLDEPVIMIGDGFTDFEVFEQGACNEFIGFGLHSKRDIIKEKSPHFVTTIEEFEHKIKDLLCIR